MSKLTHLGDMPIEQFIKEYWQQKPLLIRQAFPGFTPPLDADELAGLSLEEDIESRLIIENGNEPWELRCGPFTGKDFAALPKDKWTLLVQAVDHYIPEIAEILDQFRFIPNWRIDDLMISYAVDGGSVGPHFDQYDVFLLQASGQRRWKTGQDCDQYSPKLDNCGLHILQNFDTVNDWILEPGDLLYLPPQLAHWGTAVGDNCMTYSIGFRAPSKADLINDFASEVLSELTEDDRYGDASFELSSNSGEISQDALARLTTILTESAKDKKLVSQWFGKLMTQPKYPEQVYATNEEGMEEARTTLITELENASGSLALAQALGSRWAFTPINNDESHIYVNGDQFSVPTELAKMLCDQRYFSLSSELAHNHLDMLSFLYATGALEMVDDLQDP